VNDETESLIDEKVPEGDLQLKRSFDIESVRLSQGTPRKLMLARNSLCSRYGAASRTLYASASVANVDCLRFLIIRSLSRASASPRLSL
jgi:hypothetical protein